MPSSTITQKSYYSFYFERNKYGILNFVSPTMFQFIYLEEGQLIARCAKGDITVNGGELLFVSPCTVWTPVFGNCEEIKGVLFHFRNWPDVDELDFPPQTIKVDENLKNHIQEIPIGE